MTINQLDHWSQAHITHISLMISWMSVWWLIQPEPDLGAACSGRCVGMAGTWPGQSVFGMTYLISLCLGLEDEKERVCQQLHTVWTGQEAFQTTERNQLCFMNFKYAFGQFKRIILTIQFALLRIRFIQHHTTLFLTHSFSFFMIGDFSFKCLPMPAMAELSFLLFSSVSVCSLFLALTNCQWSGHQSADGPNIRASRIG